MNKFRSIALWTVLTLLLLVSIYGFCERKLLSQQIWTPGAFGRFLLFAAVYIIFFGAFSLWKPELFLPAIVCFVAIYTIAAAGVVAVLAVGLLVWSSGVLGESIMKGIGAVFAILLGFSIYMFAVSLAAFLPVNYPVVYLLVLVAPLLWNRVAAVTWLGKLRSAFRPFVFKSHAEQLAFGALVFILLAHWLVALEPEVGTDALGMHLVVPSSVAMSHKWTFDVKDHIWAVMPMGADWCYTIAFLLGGEPAARLLNFAFLLCIVFLLASRSSFLIAALFAATPVVQLVTGSLFVENLWTLLAFASLLALPQHGYLTFVLLGAAAATKFGALSFLPSIGLLALWHFRKSAARLLTALGLFLTFAAPPYLTAYAKTGNPLYPFLDRQVPWSDARFKSPLTFHTLYDLTFHTSQFLEGQDGAAGFQYFLFLPVALLLLNRKSPYVAAASAIVCVVSGILIYESASNLRYLYAAMPFAMLLIGSVRLDRVATVLLAVVFCLDVYFLPSSGWHHKDFIPNPASTRARSEYLTALAPVRSLVAYLNRTHPGAAAAFFETNAIAGLRGRGFTNTWHSPEFYKRSFEVQSPDEALRLMREYGLKFFVAPAQDSHIGISSFPFEVLLRKCAEPEYRSGTFYAGHLRDTDSCDWDQPGAPAPPGKYDDLDVRVVYNGRWIRGRFADASQGTLTYTNAPGANFRFQFQGTEVTYIYTKAFNRGTAEIAIDGLSRGKVDLYSGGIVWQAATRFQCDSPGPHLLEVRNTGNSFIDLDALEVRQ